jgi:hypothetical protein
MNAYTVTYYQRNGSNLVIYVETEGNDLDAIIAAAGELDEYGYLADLPVQTPDVRKMKGESS